MCTRKFTLIFLLLAKILSKVVLHVRVKIKSLIVFVTRRRLHVRCKYCYLLPIRRDSELTARLRCARQYSTIYARTNRYKKLYYCIWTKLLAVICVCDVLLCIYMYVCPVCLYACLIQPLRLPESNKHLFVSYNAAISL